ncbi:bifunctional diguanylate cyclase/phosphodiesterase [Mycobacterium sp. ITM-2016-00318]|nr:bifunctional diguanylate cyclase/phosphodiesterase [Mycobacterium sp. ITM-2016-00318]WNG94218.1 bifunctional diguanylate cyclase/phosphodiesterase [Mycobacterium sp. ITM-2016-00318]
MAREAFHDHLTGLANRAQFLDALERAMGRRHRNGEPVAVLCLDLDNFKAVNDALGHPAGDELLIRVAGRLKSRLGDTWTVARLGGDEFAALFEGHVDALAAANSVLDALRTAIVIEGVQQLVRPSIGLTVAASKGDQTADDLLLNADLAMYAAKRDGGACVRSFVPDLPVPWELQQLTDPPAGQRDSAAASGGVAMDSRSSDGQDSGNEPSRGGARTPPAIWAGLGLLALGVAAFTLSTVVRDHAGRIVAFDGVLYSMLNISAAAFVFFRAFTVRADRLSCLLIGAGMASSAAGDVVYATRVPEGLMPSVADVLYLAFYPLVYAGMVLMMRERLKRVPPALRLDALICGLTLGALSAAIVTGPIDAALQGEPAAVYVGLAYPVGDLLLLALTAGMLPILALGHVQDWRSKGVRMTVAVNLSMVNLLDLDLVDTIDRLLTAHRVSPEQLILEITEGTFANDWSRSRKTVFALRRLGVRISLDDYGTGWSSLARLQDMSVDELKLDRVFVSRLAEDPRSIAIVRSTVALAHSLGADLVAEGVEDEATLQALRRYGCNLTQGYVHTPPLPADELLEWTNRCTPAASMSDLALHPDLR